MYRIGCGDVSGYIGPTLKVPSPPRGKLATLRVGRNKPCPCKSGKKFKCCCLPSIRLLESLSPELQQQVIAERILGGSL